MTTVGGGVAAATVPFAGEAGVVGTGVVGVVTGGVGVPGCGDGAGGGEVGTGGRGVGFRGGVGRTLGETEVPRRSKALTGWR